MSTNYLIKSTVPVLWNSIKFNWTDEYCIDQVPEEERWNLPTTNLLLEQENYYKSWGIDKKCTKHSHSFDNELDFEQDKLFCQIGGKDHLLNFLKLDPGYIIPWHQDVYAYYIKTKSVTEYDRVHRTAVMMNDWSFGQVLQFGNEVISHWKAGYTFSWNHYMWHGAANFGNKELIIMQVNYIL
jgi:hypothetical protein